MVSLSVAFYFQGGLISCAFESASDFLTSFECRAYPTHAWVLRVKKQILKPLEPCASATFRPKHRPTTKFWGDALLDGRK